MASLIIKLCSFSSNSINCNLTISAFDFLSFFIYLLSLFCYLLSLFIYLLFVSAIISFSFFVFISFYFFFISFLFLFHLFFISFSSLFYFFFIWTCLLGGFLCTIIFISLYGDAPLVLQVTASTQAPIISPFNPPPLEWSVRRTLECEQTLKFCLIKVYC